MSDGDGEISRPISWIKAAQKDFLKFPAAARDRIWNALDIAAAGAKSDLAKPMKGLGPGVFEIALKYKTNAYRTVYCVEIGDDIWVVHAFQKKSKTGINTPKQETDKIGGRIKALRKELKDEQARKK